MRNTISLMMSTCDDYKPLWNGFFKAFYSNVHWDKPSFMTGSGIFDFENQSIIGIDPKYSKLDFSSRLLIALKNVNTDLVLFMLDDFYLLSSVDRSLFNDAIKIFDNKSVGCVILHDELSHKSYCEKDYNENYAILKKEAPFRATTQAAIWRVSFLRSLLRRGESPWQFEYLASFRSRRKNKLVLYRKDNLRLFFNYPYGGVFGDGKIREEFLSLVSDNNDLLTFKNNYVKRQKPQIKFWSIFINIQVRLYPFLSVLFRFVKKRYDCLSKVVVKENDASGAIFLKDE